MSIFHSIYRGILDACYIWKKEMEQVVKDEGVLIFFIVVPLVYPLLYSWIYNNEVVREVPVCVVDQSHSALSRQFIRMCDASPDVHVSIYAQDLDEAKSLVSRQLVKGIYLIPSSFEGDVYGLKQGTVSVYCDMSLMLTYKAIFQTAQTVTMEMGTELKTKLGGHYTAREEAIAARPLDYEDVPIFSPSGGYGSSILPAVLMLILQQTLVLGIGLSAGTARDENPYRNLIPVGDSRYEHTIPIVMGKAMCYFMIFIVMGAWLSIAVPRIFHFPQLATGYSLMCMMLPYILACIFFGMAVSCMVKYRENVMLIMVFVSVPLLFLTGVSWPQSNIPGYWQGVSWLFPSTFGARAYIRLNSMGADLSDVMPELRILWIQTVCYFVLTLCVYRFQFFMARRFAMERLKFLKHKRESKMAE
ncbi:MAG: ABC transporter permease [Prevotella sp.]|nr:ABC transporter permease [Prevotella sp.]MBQ8714794.1 ABC transporter permease [Prevotella sp.]